MGDEIFHIREQHEDGCYRLFLCGELDMRGAAQLEAAMTRLCKAGALEIEVNLRDTAFIDSAGVKAIVSAREQCREHRAQFFIVPGTHASPKLLFDLMKRDGVLPWEESSAVRSPHGTRAGQRSGTHGSGDAEQRID
jgi:anti-anti-sigma factor